MVRPIKHVKTMRGGAQSQLIQADDGHFYVVKFWNNPQHSRVLANEWVASRLARTVGLPVPPFTLMDVPAEFIERCAALRFRLLGTEFPCAPGIQFASRLPTADPELPIYDYLPEPGLELVVNLADFAGMMLLDKWTCNCDGRQVIYCRPQPRQGLRVFMIDQGFCFNSGAWDFPDSPQRGVYSRDLVYRSVSGWESFQPWLDRIEAYEPADIYAIGEEVPPDWYGASDDIERLLDQLVRRRSRLRDLVLEVKRSSRAPFVNWVDRATIALGAAA